MSQVPAPDHWTYPLTFCDILAIFGLLVGFVGVIIAVQQARKVKTAEKAVADFRKKLLQQRSALRFSEIAPKALMLANRIRIRDWPVCAELGTSIGASLSSAYGFCLELILDEERSNLDLAVGGLEYIFAQLPVDPAENPDGPTIQEMTKKCMLIVYGVERIAGRLKSLDDPAESS